MNWNNFSVNITSTCTDVMLICMTSVVANLPEQKGPQLKIAKGPENENSPLAGMHCKLSNVCC